MLIRNDELDFYSPPYVVLSISLTVGVRTAGTSLGHFICQKRLQHTNILSSLCSWYISWLCIF
ncbi:MAG: hypothetical protein ACKPKO_17765 [Candidatus Fonsibacter sp.]